MRPGTLLVDSSLSDLQAVTRFSLPVLRLCTVTILCWLFSILGEATHVEAILMLFNAHDLLTENNNPASLFTENN